MNNVVEMDPAEGKPSQSIRLMNRGMFRSLSTMGYGYRCVRDPTY